MFRRAFVYMFRILVSPLLGTGLGKLPLVMKSYDRLYHLVKPNEKDLIEVQGSKMYMDTSDSLTPRFLYMIGIYEKRVTDFFKERLTGGMTMVDLGADVGYYTLLAAKLVGKRGRVFAFEPSPDNYSLLLKNVQVNGYTNVIPVNKAVSNQTSIARLFLESQNKANHRLWAASGMKESVEVEATTLDDFFKDDSSRIDIVKMNIMGWEAAALQGMANTIKRNPKLRIISGFWPEGLRGAGFSPSEFLNRLLEYGFDLYYISDNAVETTDVNHLLELAVKRTDRVYIYCERK